MRKSASEFLNPLERHPNPNLNISIWIGNKESFRSQFAEPYVTLVP